VLEMVLQRRSRTDCRLYQGASSDLQRRPRATTNTLPDPGRQEQGPPSAQEQTTRQVGAIEAVSLLMKLSESYPAPVYACG
jgi:hypothetical protein